MELSKRDIKILKGIAILFMLMLHLFCRKEVNGLYETFLTIDGVPAIYYLALFGDACVPIYCFSSGYGLFTISDSPDFRLKNRTRIFKLLINYWIILLLFAVIGFFAGKAAEIPGNSIKFLLNFFLLSNSYNGAWWFVQTYIVLVFVAPNLIKLTKKQSSACVFAISGIIYLLSYVQRIRHLFYSGDHFALNIFVNAVVLLGTSQLPFVVGLIFAKEKIYSKLYNWSDGSKYKNILCLSGIILIIIIHALYESMVIAPLTAILFLCFFSLMDKSAMVYKVLNYFADHSTNIWLTHMFFYLSIFPQLAFAPRYPVLIFIWLIQLCLVASYAVNFVYKPTARMLDRKVIDFGYQKGIPVSRS